MKDYSKFPKSILTIEEANLCVKYLPCGTIAWLKTDKFEVRQAKLVRVEWVSEDKCAAKAKCEWMVAGYKEHFFGTWNKISIGVLYDSEFNAQHGSPDREGDTGALKPSLMANIMQLLCETYKDFTDDLIDVSGSWRDVLSVKCYCIYTSGEIRRWTSEINLYCDNNGMHVSIPRVDDGNEFLTYAAALAACKPKKVYTFDDEDVAMEEQKDKTVTLKVEIKESDLEKIKGVIKIIK